MNRKITLIPAIALGLLSLTGCNLVNTVNRFAPADNQPAETTTTVWYNIGEPLVAPTPDFATQTATQAPGAVDDGRFETGPAPQAPCDAPYPACGRP